MKKLFLSALATLLLTLPTLAQNNVWSLPPNYKTNLGVFPLPQQPGITGAWQNYHGQESEHTHAAMQDISGNLLFFVMDGFVYNKDGYVFGSIFPISAENYGVLGNAEVSIIPNPKNCQQYFIVFTETIGKLSGGGHRNRPIYATLDLSKPNVFNPIFNGNILNQYGAPYTGAAATYTAHDLRQGLTPSWENAPKYQNVFMATSKLRENNTRFLFVSNGETVWRYEVSSNGIRFDNHSFILDGGEGFGLNFRSEMELHQLSNGNYRIAVPYTAPFVSNTAQTRILITDLDNNGNIIQTSKQLLDFYKSNSPDIPVNIKGLEFSPNGNYLYITHNTNPLHTEPFQVYNILTQSFVPQTTFSTQFINEVADYKLSQIELSNDNVSGGRLYLVNSTGMATIDNADDPYNLNWNNSAQNFNYNLSTRGIQSQPNDGKSLYILPDQIDGMDYTDHFTIDLECCKINQTYDISVEDQTNEYATNGTWVDGNNPLGVNNNLTSPIYVKDNLTIKSGTNISINNMEFHFAPNAQLIIEDGARLQIRNSILTADDRCDTNAMWHGVEVWGKGVIGFQEDVCGKLLGVNSTITNAYEATANYRHKIANSKPIIGSEVPGSVGGIIQLTKVTLLNNQYDVYMEPYQNVVVLGGNSYYPDDKTFFNDCNFITTSRLKNPNVLLEHHTVLNQVNGIKFLGCKFNNSAPLGTYTYNERGTGIRTYNSKFTVTNFNSITSQFTNLYRGVNAESWNTVKTARITNTNFYNIWRGVYLKGMNLANVSDNTFDVGENLPLFPLLHPKHVSYGLYLDNCTGYKVAYNAFTTSFNGYLGTGINNSGTAANLIYKNNFSNLTVGTQAQKVNGDEKASNFQKGLAFKCNKYNNTKDYDILVSSGSVQAYQGFCNQVKSPANNQFSYTAQSGDYWLENAPETTIQSTYRYSPFTTGYNLEPRQGYFNFLNTAEQECFNLTTFNEGQSCPVLPSYDLLTLKQLKTQKEIGLENLYTGLDNNNFNYLTSIITQQPAMSNGQLKNELINASPLSSEILLTLINSNVSNGVLKDVLIQNAPLNNNLVLALINKTPTVSPGILKDILEMNAPLAQFIINELNILGLPNGTMNQINQNQNNSALAPSQTQTVEDEIAILKAEISQLQNDILRVILFDNNIDDGYKGVADFISSTPLVNTNSDKQMLVSALMANQDFSAAQQVLAQIHSNSVNADFCKLTNTLVACQQYPEREEVIATDLVLQQSVNDVAAATTNYQEVSAAQVLREFTGIGTNTVEDVEIVIPQNGGFARGSSENGDDTEIPEINEVEVVRVNLYPNPANKQFSITHNLVIENNVNILNIYDLMGRSLITKQINANEVLINAETLKTGVYFYSLTQNGVTLKTDKLLIE